MTRHTSHSREKTTIELESDVWKYFELRAKDEGRTLKKLINRPVHKEMLAAAALRTQAQLLREKV